VLMLGGNELGPVTTMEKAFVAFIMLAGNIINANIFGEMAVLVQTINKRSSEFQERIDNSNTVMKQIKVSSRSS